MRKVLIVMGTRPEVIKMAPIIHRVELTKPPLLLRTCITGQHKELLEGITDCFNIEAHYELNVLRKGQSLAELTSSLLPSLEKVFRDFRPDVMLVQGDTTTAFAGALTAYYENSLVGHVEAGLRTYDKRAPFPEEMNRRIVGSLADFHFAPTRRAREALLKEGVADNTILVTGNTVIDALHMAIDQVKRNPPHLGHLEQYLGEGKRVVLITGHRRENFGDGFREICAGIRRLAELFPDVTFVYPVHLNPNVEVPVYGILGGRENIRLVPPMGYLPFVRLMNAACLILTDSGGIQEEAPSLGKPVLVMRDVTERPEAVEAGTARLVGNASESIIREVSILLRDKKAYEAMQKPVNPYGDGLASHRIVEFLSRF